MMFFAVPSKSVRYENETTSKYQEDNIRSRSSSDMSNSLTDMPNTLPDPLPNSLNKIPSSPKYVPNTPSSMNFKSKAEIKENVGKDTSENVSITKTSSMSTKESDRSGDCIDSLYEKYRRDSTNHGQDAVDDLDDVFIVSPRSKVQSKRKKFEYREAGDSNIMQGPTSNEFSDTNFDNINTNQRAQEQKISNRKEFGNQDNSKTSKSAASSNSSRTNDPQNYRTNT